MPKPSLRSGGAGLPFGLGQGFQAERQIAARRPLSSAKDCNLSIHRGAKKFSIARTAVRITDCDTPCPVTIKKPLHANAASISNVVRRSAAPSPDRAAARSIIRTVQKLSALFRHHHVGDQPHELDIAQRHHSTDHSGQAGDQYRNAA